MALQTHFPRGDTEVQVVREPRRTQDPILARLSQRRQRLGDGGSRTPHSSCNLWLAAMWQQREACALLVTVPPKGLIPGWAHTGVCLPWHLCLQRPPLSPDSGT